MAMTIIDGKLSLGGLGSQYYEKGSREAEIATSMALTIQASNHSDVIGAQPLTNFLMSREKMIPRVNGQPLPLEIGNVFFTEGGLHSEARGFDVSYKAWYLKKGRMLEVKAFSHDTKEIFDARNKGLSLLEKDAQDLERIVQLHVKRYNQYARLLPLITGTSLSTKIPTTNNGGDVTASFGWVRGENVEDFIPSIYGTKTANHYRARKGSTVVKSDITDIIDLLESYSTYSGEGVVAIANQRTIEDLAYIFKAPTNQDKMAIEGIVSANFLGIDWLAIPQMDKNFIIFLDKGKTDLLLHTVNKDEAQRGLKLIQEDTNEGFKFDSGANGAKVIVFEEEWYVSSRFAGAILDIGQQESDGFMNDGRSKVKLEAFAEKIKGMYMGA